MSSRAIPESRSWSAGLIWRRWLIASVLIAVILPFGPVQRVGAATVTVNDMADEVHTSASDCSVTGTGACSLRDAVLYANAHAGTTITVPAGRYTHTTPLSKADAGIGAYLTLSAGTTIIGAGAGATIIDGGGLDRVIAIRNRTTVTISGVTIQNGNPPSSDQGIASGGAIANSGTLTLMDTRIINNKAHFGAGIFNYTAGDVTLINSTLSGNVAVNPEAPTSADDAAVSNVGTMAIVNSTISGNSVPGHAGATGGVGTLTLTITNSTVSGNGGNGVRNRGTLTITNATIAANGTDINNEKGIVTLKNSIVASSMDGPNCVGAITSAGHNLSSDTTCGAPEQTDIGGVDPKLSPLGDNGGPTQTHALLSGSPAIDVGGTSDNGCPGTDQRGIPRPQGAACDMGAFEVAPSIVKPATIASPPVPMLTPSCTLLSDVPFAAQAFQTQWNTGEAVARNFWGPGVTGGVQEPYKESPGGSRLVQYFDKGRMELTDPALGIVTNGLLATELLTGRIQVGDTAFENRSPPAIPIAGDRNGPGPTYAALHNAMAIFNVATRQSGMDVGLFIYQDGRTTTEKPADVPSGSETMLTAYDAETQHNIPAAFADYRQRVGVSTIGLAITEPFITVVKVQGTGRIVIVQAFERRVLTYSPFNPPNFQVEMGNIGQHYEYWRYCGG